MSVVILKTTRMSCRHAEVKIYIAGDYDHARRVVNDFCAASGNCFNLQPCTYIYSGGEEKGVVVTRINYAKYPLNAERMLLQCEALAFKLLTALNQKSFTITDGVTSYYHDKEVPE